MGELIPFPKPKVALTKEESKEYDALLKEIQEVDSLRKNRIVRKKVNDFLDRVRKRAGIQK